MNQVKELWQPYRVALKALYKSMKGLVLGIFNNIVKNPTSFWITPALLIAIVGLSFYKIVITYETRLAYNQYYILLNQHKNYVDEFNRNELEFLTLTTHAKIFNIAENKYGLLRNSLNNQVILNLVPPNSTPNK